ncbi:MAG: hypothetical protein ACJAUG_002509 [Halioglobus sp.]
MFAEGQIAWFNRIILFRVRRLKTIH